MSQPNVLMIGTGEYTTGYVHNSASESDKSAGVVALSLFELRRQGRVGNLTMVGTNGTKMQGIRQHLQKMIGDVYQGIDVSLETLPADDVPRDPQAYLAAVEMMKSGDLVTVFTPDDTHFEIATEAVKRKLHVLRQTDCEDARSASSVARCLD